MPPGEGLWPYHWHHANEELLLVVAGTPTLRAPDGERRRLQPGDRVVFRRGPDGAHTMRNESGEPVCFLIFSTTISPELVSYPDSGKLGARSEWTRSNYPEGAAVDYWEGEHGS